ncbi:hypothetical protein C8Q74DRAFT_362922 [Fomes fomentarius]|nr:hypothetical protein C8Q74DRAFT_362922 [Fomes fomentarius]
MCCLPRPIWSQSARLNQTCSADRLLVRPPASAKLQVEPAHHSAQRTRTDPVKREVDGRWMDGERKQRRKQTRDWAVEIVRTSTHAFTAYAFCRARGRRQARATGTAGSNINVTTSAYTRAFTKSGTRTCKWLDRAHVPCMHDKSARHLSTLMVGSTGTWPASKPAQWTFGVHLNGDTGKRRRCRTANGERWVARSLETDGRTGGSSSSATIAPWARWRRN